MQNQEVVDHVGDPSSQGLIALQLTLIHPRHDGVPVLVGVDAPHIKHIQSPVLEDLGDPIEVGIDVPGSPGVISPLGP